MLDDDDRESERAIADSSAQSASQREGGLDAATASGEQFMEGACQGNRMGASAEELSSESSLAVAVHADLGNEEFTAHETSLDGAMPGSRRDSDTASLDGAVLDTGGEGSNVPNDSTWGGHLHQGDMLPVTGAGVEDTAEHGTDASGQGSRKDSDEEVALVGMVFHGPADTPHRDASKAEERSAIDHMGTLPAGAETSQTNSELSRQVGAENTGPSSGQQDAAQETPTDVPQYSSASELGSSQKSHLELEHTVPDTQLGNRDGSQSADGQTAQGAIFGDGRQDAGQHSTLDRADQDAARLLVHDTEEGHSPELRYGDESRPDRLERSSVPIAAGSEASIDNGMTISRTMGDGVAGPEGVTSEAAQTLGEAYEPEPRPSTDVSPSTSSVVDASLQDGELPLSQSGPENQDGSETKETAVERVETPRERNEDPVLGQAEARLPEQSTSPPDLS